MTETSQKRKPVAETPLQGTDTKQPQGKQRGNQLPDSPRLRAGQRTTELQTGRGEQPGPNQGGPFSPARRTPAQGRGAPLSASQTKTAHARPRGGVWRATAPQQRPGTAGRGGREPGRPRRGQRPPPRGRYDHGSGPPQNSLLVVELLQAVPHGGLPRPRALALLQEARHVLHGGGRREEEKAATPTPARPRRKCTLTSGAARGTLGTVGPRGDRSPAAPR